MLIPRARVHPFSFLCSSAVPHSALYCPRNNRVRLAMVNWPWPRPDTVGGETPMAQTAAGAVATSAQTIEGFVGEQMDNARMGPIHWQVLALVASGYFCDVIDFTIFGALVPDMIGSGFATQYQVSWIGFATLIGLGIGTLGQGEFTDRFGRKTVYQFNLLLFGVATIVAALPPIPAIGFDPGLYWLLAFRFVAGVGLGAEQPLCFSYTAEYAPKSIRGRVIAFMQFLGGAW